MAMGDKLGAATGPVPLSKRVCDAARRGRRRYTLDMRKASVADAFSSRHARGSTPSSRVEEALALWEVAVVAYMSLHGVSRAAASRALRQARHRLRKPSVNARLDDR